MKDWKEQLDQKLYQIAEQSARLSILDRLGYDLIPPAIKKEKEVQVRYLKDELKQHKSHVIDEIKLLPEDWQRVYEQRLIHASTCRNIDDYKKLVDKQTAKSQEGNYAKDFIIREQLGKEVFSKFMGKETYRGGGKEKDTSKDNKVVNPDKEK